MTQRSLYVPAFAASILFAAGCASTVSQPSPELTAPVMMQPETVQVMMEEAEQPPVLEPGRFDTGKMWTFENAPLDYFAQEYGLQIDEGWLEHVRMASLRLPNCTASFVSENGLILTNHHCARDHASAVSREGEDLLTDGFYARTQAEERRVPDLYVDQMVNAEDVTALVEAAVQPLMQAEQEARARTTRAAAIADSASDALGFECDVQPLYNGGKYSLYCYKRHDDVRLVFIPELQIGYFGGDPDNFTYPRYVLDVSFLRVYDENGEPYRPEFHYDWSATGASEGDAVFVIGNPGSTERLSTVAQLEFARDYSEPYTVQLLQGRTDALARFMDHHPEHRSEYINDHASYMNSLKLYKGRLKALNDPGVMGRKRGFEMQFKEAVQSDPELNRAYGTLWDDIADLQRQVAGLVPTAYALRMSGELWSQVFQTASSLVDYAYASRGGVPDSVLRSLRDEIEAAEFNLDLDAHYLELQLQDAAWWLGEGDPFVRQALAGRSHQEAARAIIDGANAVVDPDQRRALLDNPASIMSSPDPTIRLAREALPRLVRAQFALQDLYEQQDVKSAQLARALFEVYGTSMAPDATFTLRLADGVVQSYEYNGTRAPAFTTFYGMYDRHYSHAGSDDWALPQRWLSPPTEFRMGTPLNMVHTNDTVGGSSGSPLVNGERQIVGLLFDGNIESLSGDFIYTDETARSVSVRSEAVVEALRHIYDARRIVEELLRSN